LPCTKIVFLDFFFRSGLTCIIMIILVVVVFGCDGILICWRLIFWAVQIRLFMFVLLCWCPIFLSMLLWSMEKIVWLNMRLFGLILLVIVLPRRLFHGFFWVTLMLFDPLMRRAVALYHGYGGKMILIIMWFSLIWKILDS